MKKIIVCVRQGLDGELGPFDAAAYEAALRIPNAEVTLLSMASKSAEDFLLKLTRLGAKKAILLSDPAFAGSDTLATAYALSGALRRLSPDLVLCGRQTLVGDTGQTGPMLAVYADLSYRGDIMELSALTDDRVLFKAREGDGDLPLPALLSVERNYELRRPRLRSQLGEVAVWTAADVGADPARCGLGGSPTRVLATFENQKGKRKCRMIPPSELRRVIAEAKGKTEAADARMESSAEKLGLVMIVGEAPRSYAESVSDCVTVIPPVLDAIITAVRSGDPDAVLFGSDPVSKALAATVAARLELGLCADCTALAAENGELIMYRPALSGSVLAKIRANTRPAMATVRTQGTGNAPVVVAAGYGVRDHLDQALAFAASLGADLAATRKMVDNGYLPYAAQVGLTGKSLAPAVYIAVGVSGAVHHIVGMERSGTVIAINPDREAPIFDYADYGILADFSDITFE